MLLRLVRIWLSTAKFHESGQTFRSGATIFLFRRVWPSFLIARIQARPAYFLPTCNPPGTPDG